MNTKYLNDTAISHDTTILSKQCTQNIRLRRVHNFSSPFRSFNSSHLHPSPPLIPTEPTKSWVHPNNRKMISLSSFLLFLLLPLLISNPTDAGLAEKLYLNFLPPNAAAGAIVPDSIFFGETPIVIRYTLIGAIAIYDPQAACQPRALSFFGTRDYIKPSFCTVDNIAKIVSYATYRALHREFPIESEVYAKFLQGLNLNPKSTSRDRSTLNGYANFIGDRIAKYFAADGWNSLGNANPACPTGPFQDFTYYVPANPAETDPLRLRRPLRWQPLTMPAGSIGRYSAQVHVVPHIGIRGSRLALSDDEARRKSAAIVSPFRKLDLLKKVADVDKSTLKVLLKEVTDANGKLTPEQRFFARYWDNKLVSTASISAYYERVARLNRFEIAQQFLGEMMAQHDALLVVWKEKRRFDQARPRTLLKFLQSKTKFRSFLGDKKGFGPVSGKNWEPLVREQAHSEFPSASAAVCTAAMEHIQIYVETKMKTKKIPDIKIRYKKGMLPFYMSQDRTVAFDDPAAAARNCGKSRLWAGVHFTPAIDAGFMIGKGVGIAAFKHMKLLGQGVVPKICKRCLKSKATILMADPMPKVIPADSERPGTLDGNEKPNLGEE